MNYQEFLNYLKDNFLDYLISYEQRTYNKSLEADAYTIELHPVTKNNGIKLDGIIIRRKNECISPNIYLNSYFDEYKMGKPISRIMEEIAKQYFMVEKDHKIQVDNLLDYHAIKNRLILRLVNYDKNKELLERCPHKRYLDLAITYRYMAEKDERGIASSLISYEEFSNWGIDEEELYQVALFNTMREFPWHMESIATVILDCLKRTLPDDTHREIESEIATLEENSGGVNMFVLSNDSELNGASCILYDSVIRNFARLQERNVIVLPSSIHEVILVPEEEDTDVEFLQDLVLEANQSAVGLIDLLSNHIYYYNRETDSMNIYEPKPAVSEKDL